MFEQVITGAAVHYTGGSTVARLQGEKCAQRYPSAIFSQSLIVALALDFSEELSLPKKRTKGTQTGPLEPRFYRI